MSDRENSTTSEAAFECIKCGAVVISLPCSKCGCDKASAIVRERGIKSNPFIQATTITGTKGDE